MTKNILVTDETGKVIGATYPKRAKGLIKSGRATEVDEGTIRLVASGGTGAFSDALNTSGQDPGVVFNHFIKEDMTMANKMEFKARAFKLVPECETNRGTRLVVTEAGENVECFELAEGGAKTEIAHTAELQKDTDYVFRFTLKSRYIRLDLAECMVQVYFDEEGDGYTYPLDRDNKNRFKPTLCKKTEDGLLRVFELPFNSGDASKCTIRITVSNMTAWVYPAKDAQAYEALPDVDYEQWRQDAMHQVTRLMNDLGNSLGETLNGIGEFVGGAGDKIIKTVNDVIRPTAKDDDIAEPEEGAEAEDIGSAEETKPEEKTETTEDKKDE
jgi:hypothetical protein